MHVLQRYVSLVNILLVHVVLVHPLLMSLMLIHLPLMHLPLMVISLVLAREPPNLPITHSIPALEVSRSFMDVAMVVLEVRNSFKSLIAFGNGADVHMHSLLLCTERYGRRPGSVCQLSKSVRRLYTYFCWQRPSRRVRLTLVDRESGGLYLEWSS
jgi:hypothetical protein